MLLLAIFLMVVVLLVSVGTLLWYTALQRKAPRTEVERELEVAQAAVQANPKDVTSWARLAEADARIGRYAEAEAAVANGRKVQDSGLMAVVFADIARFAGNKAEAVSRYEVAKKKATAEYNAKKKDLQGKGIKLKAPNSALIEATVAQGQVYMTMGRFADAKADFDSALKLDPTMADVLAMRGDSEARLGDLKAAEKDYRTALTYVPQMAAARNGLDALGKGQ
jgi:tetratricopeptide (TPR) repeat protein